MIFAEVALAEALGGVMAHSRGQGKGLVKKGQVLSPHHLALLQAQGIELVYIARLGPDDIGENEAAAGLAAALGQGEFELSYASAGRVNIFARQAGLFLVDRAGLTQLNRMAESITIASLKDDSRVEAGQMVATVKIIPYGVAKGDYERAVALASRKAIFMLAVFGKERVGLIVTRGTEQKKDLSAKAEKATADRLAALGNGLEQVIHCGHEVAAVTQALTALSTVGCSLILVAGAIASVDRGDIIPAALSQAGGAIKHFGMPVDPGNLLLLGALRGATVVGVPSCARSLKRNGFDLVLERLIAGIEVSAEDVSDMGEGGLLAEIPSRPKQRALPRRPKVAGIILAAGLGQRMQQNKMLVAYRGKPLLSHALATAQAARLDQLIVVTGHEAQALLPLLAQPGVLNVITDSYGEGLSASLKAGLEALGSEMDAVLVMLGDMPAVREEDLQRLIAAFDMKKNHTICVPIFNGQRGNPVLWGRQHVPQLMALTGDRGGKALLAELADQLVEVPMSSAGVLSDVDTPQALQQLQEAAKD